MPLVNFLRMSGTLLACLGAACIVIAVLFQERDKLTDLGEFANVLASTIAYALPVAMVAGIFAEVLRLRQLASQIALAIAVALTAATVAVRNETIASPVFAGGAWKVATLAIVASLAALAFWLIWGRHSGWRGAEIERADAAATEACEAASLRAVDERCVPCLTAWGILALTGFLLFGWGSLAFSRIDVKLVSDVEAQGKLALATTGYQWAKFSVEEDRGVLTGIASSKEDAEAAQETLRLALAPVTGIPGVIAGIDSIVTLREPAAPQPPPDQSEPEPAPPATVAAAEPSADAAPAQDAGQAPTPAHEPEPDPSPASASGDEVAALPPAAPADSPPADMQRPVTEDAADEPSAPVDEAQPADRPPCNSDQLAVIKSSMILFERQRIEIAANYDGELERLAGAAQACAPWAMLIAGHADTQGDNLFNERINWLRAMTVRDDLIARGVPPDLLVASSGDTSVQARKSEEETAFNRRAEFRLVEPGKITRDATQDPSARAENCDSDLSTIMSQSIIHFATGSSRVSDQSLDLVGKLAAAIRNCGSVIVTVEGHTDVMGTREQNQLLSNRRATSVRELLVSAGVNPTRVMTHGFAATQPYDAGHTAEAYALNRRIEFKVSGKFTSDDTGGP